MRRMHRNPLVRRILKEQRAIVIALGIVLLLNILVFAVFVYPLSRRVSSVAERTEAAETELTASRAQHALATATLTGKAKAAQELEMFYGTVLPPNLGSARRNFFPGLELLARKSNVRAFNTRPSEVVDKTFTLTRLRIDMSLVGSYPAVRRFIDALERLPEFVVLDNVALSEAADPDGELTLRLELSTYYRDGAE